MNMAVGNILFKNKASHLVTYKPGPSKIQVDYCLVRRNQRKFLKDIKFLRSKECITEHKVLVFEFKIRKTV